MHFVGYLHSSQCEARWRHRTEPAGYFWHLSCMTLVRYGELQNKQISEERSNPMKVKTNTKAGSAMWGS
jgi:hypothetical protein